MKEFRKVDDNIINRLNSTSTQAEGVCGEFFKQMSEAYAQRDQAIDYCLKVCRMKEDALRVHVWRCCGNQLMDEDLDKKNRKLQEDPDDFDIKNSIFTQESMVMYIAGWWRRFVLI